MNAKLFLFLNKSKSATPRNSNKNNFVFICCKFLANLCKSSEIAFKTYNPMVQWAAVKTHPSLIKVPPQKLNPDGFIKAAWYLISPGKTSLP